MKHILIDARFRDGSPGGIQQVVIGLAQGLGQLNPSEFHFTFLMLEEQTAWLEPYLPAGGELACVPCEAHSAGNPSGLQRFKSLLRDRFGHLLGQASVRLPSEPAIVHELKPDLIHFVHQNCFQTERPFLFTPHDLQHEYYPENFTKRTVMVRRYLYKYYAAHARAVVCISKACQDDVVKYLGVTSEKCPVIYNAPVTEAYQQPTEAFLASVREQYDLPQRFFFYPARTFPHKNHLLLVRAVAKLRDEGIDSEVVCSGAPTAFYGAEIRPLMKKLDVASRFHFVGFVSTAELNALYELSMALVFPSRFEGFGLPLIEAMRAGLPVACSNVSCIPEIASEAALFFDPVNVTEMATAMAQISRDASLARSLADKGRNRSMLFSWKQSAQQYLDLYRSILH
jgi:glycosyltransferase involved in cell wall biosynthesis